jgi:Zn-dependent peptidase ImmA (M78 family)
VDSSLRLPDRPAQETTTAVDWSGLRARCHQRIDDLLSRTGLPYPWGINQFLDRLERHRGRDIDLCAVAWSSSESYGAWQQHPDHDVIAYAEYTSGFHQDYIILHEIGHMISNHRGRCVLSREEAQRIAPDLAPAALAHLLHPSGGQLEEQEAETIAALIQQRACVRHQLAIDLMPQPQRTDSPASNTSSA